MSHCGYVSTSDTPQVVRLPGGRLPVPLYGRLEERLAMSCLLARSDVRRGAIVLQGAPGVGTTALLNAATSEATRAGLRVVRADATQSNRGAPYATVAALVRQVWDGSRLLPSDRRELLQGLWAGDVRTGNESRVAAAIELLLATCARPVVIVDHAHWLDPSSDEVIGLLANGTATHGQVVLLAAARAHSSQLRAVPRKTVRALADPAIDQVMRHVAFDLPDWVHEAIRQDAAGNPLALHELAAVWRESPAHASAVRSAGHVPMTTRLARCFALATFDLPPVSRTALLVAALDPQAELAEIVAVTSAMVGHEVSLDAFAAAEDCALVTVAPDGVRFEHPLTVPAILSLTPLRRRQEGHRLYLRTLELTGARRSIHHTGSVIAAMRTAL